MSALAEYEEFLGQKVAFERSFGFKVNPFDIHPILLPHQRDIVQWAVQGGRRGRAVELNPTSYRDAVVYQREMDRAGETPSLFDMLDLDGAA
jgi:hypothetical protein